MGRKLELVWHDPTSQVGDSPAWYRTDGGIVLQGEEIRDEQTRSQLQYLGEAETAVFVPDHVLDVLVREHG